MKYLKKFTTMSALSLFANIMEIHAITIVEGDGMVEDRKQPATQKPNELGSFRKKDRYKNIEILRVNFEDNMLFFPYGKNRKSENIIKIDENEMIKIINNIKKRNTEKEANRWELNKSQHGRWNYRSIFELKDEVSELPQDIVFEFEKKVNKEQYYLLNNFFSHLNEKRRLRDEIRFVNEEDIYIRITPYNIEKLEGRSNLNLGNADKESIVQTILEKCFTDNITNAKHAELYVHNKQDEVIAGFHQYRKNFNIYFDSIRTLEHTEIVRAFFDRLREVKHFSGEVHLNVTNGEHYVIGKDRITFSLPVGFEAQMSGINYRDYLETYLDLLPKMRKEEIREDSVLSLQHEREETEELPASPSHVSDDEISQPSSRRLSDS